MNKIGMIIFCILLGVSLASSIIFSDPDVAVYWIYSLTPLLFAASIPISDEMKYRSQK